MSGRGARELKGLTPVSPPALFPLCVPSWQPKGAEGRKSGNRLADQASYMTARSTYQLVLPPGRFLIWVERDGQPVSRRIEVRVETGDQRFLQLVAEYDDSATQ